LQSETTTAISEYYEMLGGNWKQYPLDTGRRVTDFCKELATKRDYDKFTTFKAEGDEMIIGNHLRLFSICEHHLLPFFGEVAIGYIPNDLIFGISKLQRLIDKHSSKPQLQERITTDIRKDIEERIHPKGVAVQIKAIHTCVFARGVQSSDAQFTTTSVSGNFKENAQTRNEFLQNVNADGRFKI
jgi:GTP cyclohydrolase I